MTIRTTESLIKLRITTQYLIEEELKDINGVEVKNYTQVGDNYDSAIKVRESRKTNIGDTSSWTFVTAIGSYYDYLLGAITFQLAKKKTKKLK